MADLIGSIRFLVPNGVAFVQDFDNRLETGEWKDNSDVVASSPNSLLLRTTHGQVGLTEIQVWEGLASDADGTLVYRGGFDLKHGYLWISDVEQQNSLVAIVDPGTHTIEIYADVVPMPSLIALFVSESSEPRNQSS
jgi:hypothetical protein